MDNEYITPKAHIFAGVSQVDWGVPYTQIEDDKEERIDGVDAGKTPKGMTEQDFDAVLQQGWEQIALYAFTQYTENGRGAVFFDRHGLAEDILHDQVDLGYAVYEDGKPDARTAAMIVAYDPEWEIVLQYMGPEGDVRSTRVRTAPGSQPPSRIYLFERLAK